MSATPDRINGMPTDRESWLRAIHHGAPGSDAEQVADHAIEHLKQHGWASAWHSAAAVRKHRCSCAQCAPAVRRIA
jgi:hypothetical protein